MEGVPNNLRYGVEPESEDNTEGSSAIIDPRKPKVRATYQRAHRLVTHRAVFVAGEVKDPLVEQFRDDVKIMEIGCDAKVLSAAYSKSLTCYALTCPCCFLPGALLLCTPCATCNVQRVSEKAALAHHLVLRERSLLYALDEHLMPVAPPSVPCIPLTQSCSALAIPRVQICVPLEDDVQFEILQPVTESILTGEWYPVETLLVRSYGQIVCAIDAPKDAAEFVTKAMQQIERVRSSTGGSGSVEAILNQQHKASVTPAYAVAGPGNQSARIEALRQKVAQQQEILGQRRNLLTATGNFREQAAAPPVAEIVRDTPYDNPFSLMTVQEVGARFRDLGMDDAAMTFEKHRIDGTTLSLMDEAALVELGIESSLSRKKILGWIQLQNRALALQ